MGYPLKQSQTARPLLFRMTLASDHVSPATGKSPTVTLSKNGAAFAATAGAVTEIANGWYKVAANATDANTLGPLTLVATAALCDQADEMYEVVAYDPDAATDLGLSSVAFLKNVEEGDWSIDTAATPWNVVVKTKGTATELIRKKLRDAAGADLAAVTTAIGSVKES